MGALEIKAEADKLRKYFSFITAFAEEKCRTSNTGLEK